MSGHRSSPKAQGVRSTGLDPADMIRYGRHLSLPGFGVEGQRRLLESRVAVVGLGGLGCPAALYLAAAGAGTLGLIDGDVVDASNLQRQVLFGDADVGRPKVRVAAERLGAAHRGLSIREFATRLDSSNALDILSGFDLVLDGTDNFPARYLINDAAVILGIPVVHGSVLRFEGRVSVFGSPDGPCYRCLYPEPPPPGVVQDCRDAGVLGVMPGLVGVLQATEAIKVLCGIGDTLDGRLLVMNAWELRFHSIRVARDPRCPACGTREITHLIDYDAFCSGGSGTVRGLQPGEAASRLRAGAQLVDVRERWEWEIGRLPGATWIPLGELPSRLSELDASRETIVYCHHGVRSLEAARLLLASGFGNVVNLDGGIDQYSARVDGEIPRY